MYTMYLNDVSKIPALPGVFSIPEPGSMLTTPGGKPALTTNSANFNDVNGVT